MMKKAIACRRMCSNESVRIRRSMLSAHHGSWPIDVLGNSSEVLQLLKNQHLRTMIKALDRSINPADEMQKAMVEPIFVQFVDQLLKVVENKDTQ